MDERRRHRLLAATRDVPAPLAVLDTEALFDNARALLERAGGTPIRVASKSVRCREVLRRVLAMDGFRGILSYRLDEALWLSEEFDDIVVAYPTVDPVALRRLVADDRALQRVTLMVDCVEHLDLIDDAVGDRAAEIRICLDLDASLDLPRMRMGVWRSPVHQAGDLLQLAEAATRRVGFRVVGVMAYEAQIAGLGDRPTSASPLAWMKAQAIRRLQARSVRELQERRGVAVAAVRQLADLEFVNGGGTGSIESTCADPSVTEVAAGSGLYAPTLFDGYRRFCPQPALYFALDVTRHPAPGMVTAFGGGWVASGPPGRDRVPRIVWPRQASPVPLEMFGEVQTPIRVRGRVPALGERIWLRHAKAGELCEHVNELHAVTGSDVAAWSTYRGEGQGF